MKSVRRLLGFWLLAGVLLSLPWVVQADVSLNAPITVRGRLDASTALSTAPMKSGTLAQRPSSCVAHVDFYNQTDAVPAGQRLFACNSTGNGWVLVSEGLPATSQFGVNVKAPPYNAVGDGVANDTAAIQAALNAGAGIVYIPAGEYSVTTLNLPWGVTMQGAGMASAPFIGTRLIQPDGVNASLIQDSCSATTDYQHWSQVRDLQLRKVANETDTIGSGIEIDCRSGEGLRFDHLLIIGFPDSGIHYKHGGVPIFITDIHVFGHTEYGINVDRTGADNYQMVSLHGISGDSNDIALIRLATGGAATDGFHLSDIKAEATGPAPVRQPTVILLETLQSAPVQIENVSVQATGGATVAEVIKITGGNARLFASHIKCNGCTNLINDQVASVTIPYGTGDSMWFTYSGGRFNRVNATGMAMESMALGRSQTPLTTSAGLLAQVANTNNVTLHSMQRSTDTSPTGNFANYTSATGTALWTIDVTGSLTAGTVPAARVSGALSDTHIPDLNTLSTGLSGSRCVETTSGGFLTVAAGACGTGGGGSGSDLPIIEPMIIDSGIMTPGPDGDATGIHIYTAYDRAAALAIPGPSGVPSDGKEMRFIIQSPTPQDLTFTQGVGGFCASAGFLLPSTTTGSNLYDHYTYRYNADAACWILVGSTQGTAPLGVPAGGTGASTLAAHGVLVGQGTGTVISKPPTANNQCLLSHATDYANNDPFWGSCAVLNAADITSDSQVWTGSPTWATGEQLTLCNTADCTTNFERGRLLWSGNVLTLRVESGGTGTARALRIEGSAGGIHTGIGGIQLLGSAGGFVTVNPFNASTGIRMRSTEANDANAISHEFISNNILAPTSGTSKGMRLSHSFSPTSGTAGFVGLSLDDTINQTGGANAVTYGLYVNPTLTAAADYRSIGFRGDVTHKMHVDRHPTANTAGLPLSLIAGGAAIGATDKNGGNLVLTPGTPSGTGRSYIEKRCFTTATVSSTADGTEYLCGVEQVVRVLTDGSATNVLTMAVPSNTANIVMIDYSIVVTTAGNQFQVVDGRATCRLYNSAGTPAGNTCTNTRTDTLQTGSVTVTWAASAADPSQITVTVDSSLTPSAGYPRLQYAAQVFGQGTLTVQ